MFQPFADAGFDVFVFDYRGYGRSEGRRRLRAMLSDYREIVANLDARGYASRAFYGMSFGGIVLLDALRDDAQPKSLIIDSTPSRLSDYGCPEAHDPVANMPSTGSNLLIVVGDGDHVVTREMSQQLVDRARRIDAEVIADPRLGHPLSDGRTERRFTLIVDFLQRRRTPR